MRRTFLAEPRETAETELAAEKSRARRVLVITPTFNERENLEPFADALFFVLPEASLLVVDDASPDGTGDVADRMAARDSRVQVLHRPEKLGLGTAYVAGFERALAEGFDVAIEMDADLSHDARVLPRLLLALEQGADIAVGSRNVPGGGILGWGMGRTAISKGGSLYAKLVLGVSVNDLTTGFKAYTARALRAIRPTSLRSNGYSFQIETTYRALRMGLTVVEVPIVFVDRRAGQSKLSKRIFAEAVVEVWRLRIAAARGLL